MPLPEMELVEQTPRLENIAPPHDFTYWQLAFYLLCFAVVLFLAYKLTRWLGGKIGGRSSHYLGLVETLYMGPNRSLHLVRVGKQLFLVASAERSLTLLTEITDLELLMKLQEEVISAPVEAEQGATKGFADYLKKLLESGATQKEPTPGREVHNSAQRIEERLMKFRTHQGQKKDE